MAMMRVVNSFAALCASFALVSCAPAEPESRVAAAATGEAVAAGEATMRRLTAEQYQNIVLDLFGPTVELGGRFEPELRVGGLLAVGAANVGMTASGMEQYDMMARRIASQVLDEERRGMMLTCTPQAANAPDDACARQFLNEIGSWLYRRPLTESETESYVATAHKAAERLEDFHDGLSLSLAAMLTSPRFLYRQETFEPDPTARGQFRLTAYAKASQLSFFLWNSGPDRQLLEAARTGEIHTARGYARQVDRMLQSPLLERGARAFFVDAFHFDLFDTLTKDAAIYPKFSARVLDDAQEQTLRTVVDHTIRARADYRDIFTTRKTFLTQELAAIYRVPLAEHGPNGAPDVWQAVTFPDEASYAGVLTHIAFTALHSHPGRSSPTIRGKAVREIMLCQKVPAPPGNVDFNLVQDPSNPAYKTMRQRLTAHSSEPMCAGCHKITDPMGFALESFDGDGGFRRRENGALIDTTGTLDGKPFADAASLGEVIRENPAAPQCLVNRLTSYAIGREVKREPWVRALEAKFAASGYVVPDLMRAIALHDVFFRVSPPSTETRAAEAPSGPATPKS